MQVSSQTYVVKTCKLPLVEKLNIKHYQDGHMYCHTSSMNRTPGMIVALPSSLHSATLESICSLTSDLISPVSPANKARKPCG